MNGLGEIYESKYGVRTCERVYGTTKEIQEGRGPCYLKTDQISKELEEDLYKAYLNMAPSQTLKWLEGGQGPSEQNVEIQGTEPYIVGGHTASGYWVDNGRATTIRGLYAAGDVCGGAPQKYVTGALVEGKLAAESIIGLLQDEGYKSSAETLYTNQSLKTKEQEIIDTYQTFLNNSESYISIDQVEETMQKVMDEYAGGITSNYQFNETGLKLAKEKIIGLEKVLETLSARKVQLRNRAGYISWAVTMVACFVASFIAALFRAGTLIVCILAGVAVAEYILATIIYRYLCKKM